MEHRAWGGGLMLAGLIVSLVGIVVIMVRVWQVPGYWIPLAVGVGLMLLGAIRRTAGWR